jgi:hypothetical protein
MDIRTPTRLDNLASAVTEEAEVLAATVPEELLSAYWNVKIALEAGIKALKIAGITTPEVAMNLLERGLLETVADLDGRPIGSYSIATAYNDHFHDTVGLNKRK